MLLLLYSIWGITTAIVMLVSSTWGAFIGMAFGGLITIAVVTLIIVLISPLKISENGFIIKDQKPRAIYSIKPINLIFFQCISVFTKGYANPILIPFSVGKKSKFIEDLIRYAPDENQLKVYVTTGRIINFTSVTEDDVLVNNPMAKSQVNAIYENEIFRAEQTLKNGVNLFY